MDGQQNADLTNLLRWSIENTNTGSSDPANTAQATSTAPSARTQLDQEALRRLVLGGPSDADRMRDAMAAIQHPDTPLDDKLTAFDNFEQLVEQIDNANNMEALQLWAPLVGLLGSDEPELRKWAAWCLATAVANNGKAQERMLVLGAIPTLVKQATDDDFQDARKKAILALSSGVRNYQPALDKAVEHIPSEHLPGGAADAKVDAADMEAIDAIMSSLRASSAKG